MPGLARKIIICAAVDGLVVHPLNSRGKDGQQSAQRTTPQSPVRIKYGDASISTIAKDAAPDLSTLPPNSSFEAYGIVGMDTLTIGFTPSVNRMWLTSIPPMQAS